MWRCRSPCGWARGQFEAHELRAVSMPVLCLVHVPCAGGRQGALEGLSEENLLMVGVQGEGQRSSVGMTLCTLTQEQS